MLTAPPSDFDTAPPPIASAERKVSQLAEAIIHLEAAEQIFAGLNLEGERVEDLIAETEHEHDYLLVTEFPAYVEALDTNRMRR